MKLLAASLAAMALVGCGKPSVEGEIRKTCADKRAQAMFDNPAQCEKQMRRFAEGTRP